MISPAIEMRLRRDQIADYITQGIWSGRQIFDDIVQHVQQYGENRPAVSDDIGRYTYGELLRLADQVALGLLALGVRQGDVVSIQLPNWREFVPTFIGVERIGAIVNPLAVILREHELVPMLRLAGTRVLIVPGMFQGFDHAACALALREQVPSLEQVVVVRGSVPGALTWEELLEQGWQTGIPPRVLDYLGPRISDIAELAFTSGTTGTPKGVMHTHGSARCGVASTIRRQRLGPDDIFHVVLPVGHNAGYFYGVRLALQSGGHLVLQERWDAEAMVELVRDYAVTYSIGTPTHVVDLLAAQNVSPTALSSLRVYTCAGADTPRHVAAAMLELIPRALRRAFGMTEIGHVTSTDAHSTAQQVIHTEGSVQPEMELRIADEGGKVLPTGQEGHLEVRGPFVFAGYVQGRAFTEEFFHNDFFRTGDLGYLDKEGYLHLTGRAKDIIIRGGEKVPTREIEDLLRLHPKVREVAIVPVSDARLGERAVACIQLWQQSDSFGLEELVSHLADQRVTKHFWPEEVVLVADFPRTASGKIQKSALRQRLEAEHNLHMTLKERGS